MKKIGSLFLSLLMIFSVCAVSVSADSVVNGSVAASDSAKMLDTLSDTIWNFENLQTYNDTTGSYTDVNSKEDSMGGYFWKGQSFLSASASTVEYDQTEEAMKVEAKAKSGSSRILMLSYSAAGESAVTEKAVNVRFTMKAATATGERAAFVIRDNAAKSSYCEFVTLSGGKISLCNTEVASYEAGKWYTFDVRVNLTEKYARLYLTPGRSAEAMNGETTNATTYYDVCYESLVEIGNATVTPGGDKLFRMGFGFRTSATAANWYVGEFYQNGIEAPRPTLESLNSDFNGAQDSFLVAANGATTKLYQTTWTSGHVNALATVADGVAVVNSNANGARARISRYPFRNNTAPKRRYRIDVSVGGAAGSSVAFDFGNKVYTLCYLQSTTEMRLATGELKDQGTGMNANYTLMSVAMPTDEKTPLRVKVFYDETSRTGVVGVTSGGSFSCSEFSVPTTETAAFKGISLYAAGSGKSAYYDNFTWDITPSEVSLGAYPMIAYTDESAANLDETVTFTYSETLRQTENAAVTVEANGETVTPPYTLSYDDNKLLVRFSGLAQNTSYTVSAPTLTTLSGLDTGSLSQSISFTTAQSGASEPKLSGDKITAKLNVTYAEAAQATMFVVVYKADGSLKEILHAVGKGSRDKAGMITIAAPELETGETWQAFVWSGLNSMEAYSPVGSQS